MLKATFVHGVRVGWGDSCFIVSGFLKNVVFFMFIELCMDFWGLVILVEINHGFFNVPFLLYSWFSSVCLFVYVWDSLRQ